MPTKTITINSNGRIVALTVSNEDLRKEPGLKAALERIEKKAAQLADYGNSYERGGGHDKTFDKEPGHDRSHSKSA